jgi:hypothetical protein
MRHSNHAVRGRRLTILFVGLFGMGLAACGSSTPPSAEPSAAPTLAPTPDPHLKEPVTADDIFRDIGKGGLRISPTNANLGQGNPSIVKVINGDIDGWPIRITQYTSAAVLARSLDWTPGGSPGGDEAPYAFAGLNVLITFGPISAKAPSVPEPARTAAAATLVQILDPLLWPLTQRTVTPIPSRTAAPVATPTPSPAATPKATPKPSAKPKVTPKPTKRP